MHYRIKTNIFLTSLLVTVLTFSTGCSQESELTVTSSPTPTSTEVMISFTPTPTNTPTETLIPTITSTPTVTFTPTITASPTMTLAPTATFSPQDQYEFVLDLIRNNGGCELPCLWGITPGKSTTDDYKKQLEPLNDFINDNNYFAFSKFVYLRPIIENRKTDILVYSIYTVNFDDNGRQNGRNWQVYNAMEPYAINNVFSRFGIPDRVLLGAEIGDWTTPGDFSFGLGLFYEDIGALIFYSGPTVYPTSDGIIRHCFSYAETEYIRMYLHSPEDGFNLEEVIDRRYGYHYPDVIQNMVKNGVFHDVEDATGVSIEEFYDIYKNPTSRCLESSIDIWGR